MLISSKSEKDADRLVKSMDNMVISSKSEKDTDRLVKNMNKLTMKDRVSKKSTRRSNNSVILSTIPQINDIEMEGYVPPPARVNEITASVAGVRQVFLWSKEPEKLTIYLYEHLYKNYSNVCTIEKYKMDIPMLDSNNSLYMITETGLLKNPISLKEMTVYFNKRLIDCNTKRFTIIPIGLSTYNTDYHSNVLIYDKSKKTIKHFDPNGSLFDKYPAVEKNLEKIFKELKIKYLNPEIVCPVYGPQLLEFSNCIIKNTDGSTLTNPGFCLLWSLWYIELSLKYPDNDSKKLFEKAIKNLGPGICEFILNLAKIVNNFTESYIIVNADPLPASRYFKRASDVSIVIPHLKKNPERKSRFKGKYF
jgi:hypothetical protein